MRSEKEAQALKIAFLHKRLHSLEQFKYTSDKLSASIQQQSDQAQAQLDEIKKEASPTKPKDQMKARTMKSKQGNSDLEQQIELLKRIIEKQRAQLDVLEKENTKILALQQKKETKKNARADEA